MKSQRLFSMQNLSCMRAEQPLFKPLSFDIHTGQLWQITGDNGQGKTTLLRTLAGLNSLYQGTLIRAEFPLFYLGHVLPCKEKLTVIENLEYLSAIHHFSMELLTPAFELLQLEALRHRYFTELSAGQQRKVGLALLWACSERVWLLDEPFNALDALTQAVLANHFTTHIKQGGTVIFTSHQSVHFPHVDLLNLERVV